MTTETKPTMLPYKREDIDIYALIDFAPDEPEPLPDAMLQNRIINRQILSALDDRLSDFGRDPAVFVDSNTILCYDRSNLNVRIQPDFYAAFGVDAQAILERELYLPWEVGKPPDFALEVASKTTARHDVEDKVGIYRDEIGVPELWYVDPTGGDLYGQPLAGWRLAGGIYLPLDVTESPDGFISGYSPTIDLYICWEDGELRFLDPHTNEYLTGMVDAYDDRAWALAELDSERAAHAETRDALARQRRALERERRGRESDRQALERERETRRRLEERIRRLRESE